MTKMTNITTKTTKITKITKMTNKTDKTMTVSSEFLFNLRLFSKDHAPEEMTFANRNNPKMT